MASLKVEAFSHLFHKIFINTTGQVWLNFPYGLPDSYFQLGNIGWFRRLHFSLLMFPQKVIWRSKTRALRWHAILPCLEIYRLSRIKDKLFDLQSIVVLSHDNTFWALVSAVPLMYYSCIYKEAKFEKNCQNIFQYNLKFKRCRREAIRERFCNNWN